MKWDVVCYLLYRGKEIGRIDVFLMKRDVAKRILIVDDDPLILYALSKALSRDDMEIKTVSTGEEAIIQISSRFYVLCFLDINLPDLSGLAVMKRLKEISPQTKIAMMTASHVDDDMKRAIDDTADYFIAKPFNIFQIKAIAKSALEDGAM